MSDNNQQPQQYSNELRGALFTNNKGGNDKRPDYRGRCTIDGEDYRISGWVRTAVQSGQRFLSLSFTPEAPKETEVPVEEGDFATPQPQDNQPIF